MLAAGSVAWCSRAAGGGGGGGVLRAWLSLGAEPGPGAIPVASSCPSSPPSLTDLARAGGSCCRHCPPSVLLGRGAAPTKAVSGGRCSRHLLLFSVPAAVTEGL